MTPRLISLAVALVGAATHLAYFNRAEHHLHGVFYLQLFLALFTTAITAIALVGHEPIANAFAQISILTATYLSGLYTSLILYRTLFHPLSKFPGPFGARISNLWFSAQLKNADAHKTVLKLHEQYGDFLRIGSSDLSIVHSRAVSAIYGLGSKCTKAAFYDLTYPVQSLHTVRSRAVHDRRRRIWSAAFSEKALRGYEERMRVFQDQLIAQIRTFGGQPVNVTEWLSLYSFDVMGDLAFGTSFNMLKTSEQHWAIKILAEGLKPFSWMLPVWLFRVMTAIPGLADDWWELLSYCSRRLDERMVRNENNTDILFTLLEPCKDKKLSKEDRNLLVGDTQLIVVAGSDTTAITLTFALYELAKDKSRLTRLRTEIESQVNSAGSISHQKIQHLNYLNGFINETLRLHPPVPTALPRITPPEGIEIGDTYVPGNMTVWCPQYVIGRSENIYTNAQAFIPERWYSQQHLIKEK
ncbi:hypothetical protein MMC12_008522, partial [Toensbergia leucococca]|nr:hypothetical protein [Toensbergia leucococca]